MTSQIKLPNQIPLVSLKDTVVFPQSILSLYINDPISQRIVKQAFKSNKLVFISCLQEPERDSKKVYRVGCVCFIMRMRSLKDHRVKILIQGLERASIESVEDQVAFLSYFSTTEKKQASSIEEDQFLSEMKKSLKELSQVKDNFSQELILVLDSVREPGPFCDMLLNNLELKTKELQKALETIDVKERMKMTKRALRDELQIFKLQGRIKNLLNRETTPSASPSPEKFKTQFNSYKKEEIREYRQKLEEKNFPDHVKKEAEKQVLRLERMHTESSEASMVRNYLDWLFDLPWNDLSEDSLDLKRAQNILDEDHFELKKVKERILEFLAVCHLKSNSLKGPILCFSGPPGVGKTSLGKSIAKSMGRSYHRISLGGIKDEAEIRGHRRTYVGAMPGKIIQALKDCETKNPVLVLDEIDKLCSDFRGDPSSALLEVLDPEQNHSFKDHYLNLEFDLSKIFFIATANLVHNIPPALRDRLEVIPITGYTMNEKKHIAKRYLVSRELKNSGLPEDHVTFTEEGLDILINSYTKEAGLRNLNRQISSVCRKVAKKLVLGDKKKFVLDKEQIINILGSPFFHSEERLKTPSVGIATGLAWTEAGGEILYVEAIKIKGKKGGLTLTGKLGEVMKESAQAALSYVKSYTQKLNIKIEEEWFDKNEIHIHLPGGAIPKDGPSAGVTLASTLLSLVTNTPLKNTIAMTGEITLSGRVLPVGGIKEKVLAAFNHGIKAVILPEKNKKDLEELPKEIKSLMTFFPVSNLDEVFKEVLLLESPQEKATLKEYFEEKDLGNVA